MRRAGGANEVAQLSRSFNRMADSVQPITPAGAAVLDAASLRLGRLPRAAHAPDHREDGRGGALQTPART
ncbi:hypothetical protein QJS66_22635 [Kocuria rhizophila]|nr:hypothetical protein QJS66_22635 [Kocuria rhizophila]